jgi:hypothetical protein
MGQRNPNHQLIDGQNLIICIKKMSPQSLKCLLSILQTVPVNSQFIDYVVPKMLWPIRSVTPHLRQSKPQSNDGKEALFLRTHQPWFLKVSSTIFAAEIPTGNP